MKAWLLSTIFLSDPSVSCNVGFRAEVSTSRLSGHGCRCVSENQEAGQVENDASLDDNERSDGQGCRQGPLAKCVEFWTAGRSPCGDDIGSRLSPARAIV